MLLAGRVKLTFGDGILFCIIYTLVITLGILAYSTRLLLSMNIVRNNWASSIALNTNAMTVVGDKIRSKKQWTITDKERHVDFVYR